MESRVYPSDEQIKQATGVERIRLERLRQSAATISIWSNYLSDITYVHTPAMSLIQLICYLGGLAGLWLGVSVMTVSGWLAQLYPFMQKWNYKQRYVMLTCRRNLKYLFESLRNRYQYEKTPNGNGSIDHCCGYVQQQSSVDSTSSSSGPESLQDQFSPGPQSRAHFDAFPLDSGFDSTASDSSSASESSKEGSILEPESGKEEKGEVDVREVAPTTSPGIATDRNPNRHPLISAAARRAVYWSNYSSMSTSSDDISLISSSTSSTIVSTTGHSGGPTNTSVLRRLSLACTNATTPPISNLAKYSYRV